eukprot:350868-Chlamydomonas_euryale.AAC.3
MNECAGVGCVSRMSECACVRANVWMDGHVRGSQEDRKRIARGKRGERPKEWLDKEVRLAGVRMDNEMGGRDTWCASPCETCTRLCAASRPCNASAEHRM